jgi:hypothetical protein
VVIVLIFWLNKLELTTDLILFGYGFDTINEKHSKNLQEKYQKISIKISMPLNDG